MPAFFDIPNQFKGINSDLLPVELDPGVLTDGRNFKVQKGALVSHCGYTQWATSPGSAPYGLVFYSGTQSPYWTMYGKTKIYTYDGISFVDVTPLAGFTLGTGQEMYWGACLLGRYTVANNQNLYPLYWNPSLANFAPLQFTATQTWQAKGYTCQMMRSCRNFLIALNLTEGGVNFPDSFRWSTAADINGLPSTWDEADTSAIAGKSSLGGSTGKIVDGRSMRDSFVIYSDRSINILDYVGGTYIWNKRSLSMTTGCLATNCIVEAWGNHYFMAFDDFMMCDGSSVRSIAFNKIRTHLANNLNPDAFANSFVVFHTNNKEIWFCIPTVGSTYANIAYIYNMADDTWSIKDIFASASAGYGTAIDTISGVSPSYTYASITGTYNTIAGTYDSLTPSTSMFADDIVSIDQATGNLYKLDTPNQGVACRVERVGIRLGDLVHRKTVNRIYPRLDADAAVTIQVGSMDSPDGAVTWQAPQTIAPGQRKIDVRTSGSLFCYKVSGSTPFKLSGLLVEYAITGLR